MPSQQLSDPSPPEEFPVRILMRRQPVEGNRWIDHRWAALGIIAGDPNGEAEVKIVERDGSREVLFSGHRVALYRDECESYYHNIVAPEPQCYVLSRNDENGTPLPFLVSLSFDEANAYLETDDVDVHPVPMPPELYRWIESYVLTHYVPERRRKRKLEDWRRGERR